MMAVLIWYVSQTWRAKAGDSLRVQHHRLHVAEHRFARIDERLCTRAAPDEIAAEAVGVEQVRARPLPVNEAALPTGKALRET
jgi:hypothetical protein